MKIRYLMARVLLLGASFQTSYSAETSYLTEEEKKELKEEWDKIEEKKESLKKLRGSSPLIKHLSGQQRATKFEDDEEEPSEEELIVVSGYTLDLTEPIISSILLSLPMKTICDEDCKGICPNCGRDLNEGQCNCEDKNIDPRLAKLKELMD